MAHYRVSSSPDPITASRKQTRGSTDRACSLRIPKFRSRNLSGTPGGTHQSQIFLTLRGFLLRHLHRNRCCRFQTENKQGTGGSEWASRYLAIENVSSRNRTLLKR